MLERHTARVGVIHPGAMGVSVAASAVNSGHTVYWASQGRSAETCTRAEKHSLQDVGTIGQLCARSDILISICPPHAAEDVAREVIAHQYDGLFCDANAISPQRSIAIGGLLNAAGIAFVDGSIIGGPAWKPNSTWLYLSGSRAVELAECFAQGPLVTLVIGDEIGKASALKMCYAGLTKGTTALLCAILSAAEQLGVRDELYAQWTHDKPNAVAENERRVLGATEKAWRFEGEMQEIAATLGSVCLPDGFHLAAAELYHRLAPLKENPTPEIRDVLNALGR
jgi:3-hydroxyisobutyrate dehydrogenase-like beta-hydroxyacid dehydrogenase